MSLCYLWTVLGDCTNSARNILAASVAWTAILIGASGATGATVSVRVENLGAQGAVFLTPVWVGIHDGTFDTYDSGVAASAFPGLEAIAEDGDTSALSTRFATEQGAGGGVDATITATMVGPPPVDPGETANLILNITDPTVNRYFSYASMIIPSNDAFIANGSPLVHAIFDGAGQFLGADFLVFGSDVSDAGTEVNSETDVAFLAGPNGQTGPNQGSDENGVVGTHPGFNGSVGNPGGTPVNILGGTTPSGATIDTILGDFTRNSGSEPIARITVTLVPEPGTFLLGLIGVACVAAWKWRNRRAI